MDPKERAELADLVAQAVIDRLDERRQVDVLVEMVMHRMAVLQQEQAVSEGANTPGIHITLDQFKEEI